MHNSATGSERKTNVLDIYFFNTSTDFPSREQRSARESSIPAIALTFIILALGFLTGCANDNDDVVEGYLKQVLQVDTETPYVPGALNLSASSIHVVSASGNEYEILNSDSTQWIDSEGAPTAIIKLGQKQLYRVSGVKTGNGKIDALEVMYLGTRPN